MKLEKILFLMASILLTALVIKLILLDWHNVIAIFATLSWSVALLGLAEFNEE